MCSSKSPGAVETFDISLYLYEGSHDFHDHTKKTSYLLGDEGAQQCHSRPEKNAAAQNDLPVKSVAKVTEDGCCHHETADENCKRENEKFHITYKKCLVASNNSMFPPPPNHEQMNVPCRSPCPNHVAMENENEKEKKK